MWGGPLQAQVQKLQEMVDSGEPRDRQDQGQDQDQDQASRTTLAMCERPDWDGWNGMQPGVAGSPCVVILDGLNCST